MGGETRRRCFTCDGSGEMCDVCGESETACRCDEPTFSPCEHCDGDGTVPPDQKLGSEPAASSDGH